MRWLKTREEGTRSPQVSGFGEEIRKSQWSHEESAARLEEGRPGWQVTRLALLRKRRLSIAERFFRSTSRPLKDGGGPSEPAPWLWRKHAEGFEDEGLARTICT